MQEKRKGLLNHPVVHNFAFLTQAAGVLYGLAALGLLLVSLMDGFGFSGWRAVGGPHSLAEALLDFALGTALAKLSRL